MALVEGVADPADRVGVGPRHPEARGAARARRAAPRRGPRRRSTKSRRELVRDGAQRGGETVLAGKIQEPAGYSAPPARNARSAISTLKAGESVARGEQRLLARVLQQEDGPGAGDAARGLRRLAQGRRQRPRLSPTASAIGDRLEAVVGGKRPRDVVVGLAADPSGSAGAVEQVDRVVAVGLVEPHHVRARRELALLADAAARWRAHLDALVEEAPTICATRRRSPWSSGITKA